MGTEERYGDEDGDGCNFKEYGGETKVHKNSFKKKFSQAKRFLVNKASTEYSQVDEQSQPKTFSKILVSVSKINELKAMVNSKTKKYDKTVSEDHNYNNE